MGHEQFSGAQYDSFGKGIAALSNKFSRRADTVEVVEDDDNDTKTPGKRRKSAAAAASSGDGGNGGGGSSGPRGAPITGKPGQVKNRLADSIEDSRAKTEKDFRRILESMERTTEASAKSLSEVPKEATLERLRSADVFYESRCNKGPCRAQPHYCERLKSDSACPRLIFRVLRHSL